MELGPRRRGCRRLAVEFSLVLGQLVLGRGMESALEAFVLRLGGDDGRLSGEGGAGQRLSSRGHRRRRHDQGLGLPGEGRLRHGRRCQRGHRVADDDVVADRRDAQVDGVDVLLEHALDVGLEVALRATVHVEHASADDVDRQGHCRQQGHPDGVGVRSHLPGLQASSGGQDGGRGGPW